jgi:4'-phosphopantetheinyl transferase
MEKIFYANKSIEPDSETAIKRILSEYFNVKNAVIERNENGKPFLANGQTPLFFSVSHTGNKLFIAVSDENVGIDAESLYRNVDYLPILKRFAPEERQQIRSVEDFLRFWVAKESAVKWLGGSLAQDLRKLRYTNGRLFYGEIELPVKLVFHSFDTYLLAVCSERDFTGAEFIPFPL